MRVTVVGAGVVGLSCAVRLLEAGHDVAVLARDLPLETTSSVAAALWYPYRALPQDRVTSWAATTYDVLAGLTAEPDTGVVMRAGTELFRQPQPDPWWADAVPDLRRATGLPGAVPRRVELHRPGASRCRSTWSGWPAGSSTWAAR